MYCPNRRHGLSKRFETNGHWRIYVGTPAKHRKRVVDLPESASRDRPAAYPLHIRRPKEEKKRHLLGEAVITHC